MGKNTCDGDVYIHNLASFIKSHERQLANALIAYKKSNTKNNSKQSDLENKNRRKDKDNKDINNTENKKKDNDKIQKENDNKLEAQQYEDNLNKQISKPVRLSLSLHHLYFLLGKFQELNINVGPMCLRLDNIDSETSNNYVSFLSEFQRNKAISSDNQSIHSMTSVKSVMSSVSALWNTLSASGFKGDNISSDLKYLYSAFTKLPCLRLANDPNAKLIEGHEEYPFETATPIKIFKNLSVLEISDLDPKEIYGWNYLSERIRYLVVKKANIIDPVEILVDLVQNDSDNRGSGYYDDNETKQSNANLNLLSHSHSHSNSNSNSNPNLHANSASNYNSSPINQNGNLSSSLSPPNNFASLSVATPKSISSAQLPIANIASTPNGNTAPTASSAITSLTSPTTTLTTSTNSSKKNIYSSPPLNSSNNFFNPQPYYYHHYSYHLPHHHHQISHENNPVIPSTSPPSSIPFNHPNSNYHPSRLYGEDISASNSSQPHLSSSVHSSRRQYYYYKPVTKNRRSRGSTSMVNDPRHFLTSDWQDDKTVNDSNYDDCATTTNSNNDITTAATTNNSNINSSNSNTLLGYNNNHDLIYPVQNQDNENIEISKDSWKLLKHLSLTENKIEKISDYCFNNLYNLSSLDLSYNNLTSIPAEPLSKLINLKSLNLSFNKLTSTKTFPKTLTKLSILNIRGNKLVELDTIETLKSLEKLDLRQNKLSKITDLKPLLLINTNKVTLSAVYLAGNPIASNRGYRIELFNLFNGVDYSNLIKIDGSRPGIFESRMLLDPKTAQLKFNNYMDESIISKMTASVSNMNLSSMVKRTTTTTTTTTTNLPPSAVTITRSPTLAQLSNNAAIKPTLNSSLVSKSSSNANSNSNPNSSLNSNSSLKINLSGENSRPIIPLARSASTANLAPKLTASQFGLKIASNYATEPTRSESLDHSDVLTTNNNLINTSDSLLTPKIFNSSNSQSAKPTAIRSSTLSSFLDHISSTSPSSPSAKSVSTTKQQPDDDKSSIATNSRRTSQDNPINKISIASPALPVITQATTTTMTTTTPIPDQPISSPLQSPILSKDDTDLDQSNREKTNSKDLNVDPGIMYYLNNEHNDSHNHNHSHNNHNHEDDFTSGLKISVT